MQASSINSSDVASNLDGVAESAMQVQRYRAPAYLKMGFLLLTLFIVQLIFDLHWVWLEQLQQNSVYKQATGFLLLFFILMQWQVPLHRFKGELASKHLLLSHKTQGAIAPLLLYFHSVELGYAYQCVLSSVFLVNIAVGLLNYEILSIRNKIFRYGWIIVHISLAVATVFLAVYHLYISYVYN